MKVVSIFEFDDMVKAIQNEEVIGFPTETVYGLGVVYDSEKAFEKLQIVKNRPPLKPFTLMCGDAETIKDVALVTPAVQRVIDHFMPGALTLILPLKRDVRPWVTGQTDRIGVRISSHPFVLNLVRMVGKPLLVPSANKSGKPALIHYEDVANEFKDDDVKYILNQDALGGLASTIVEIIGEPKVLREGAIPFEEVLKVYKGEE